MFTAPSQETAPSQLPGQIGASTVAGVGSLWHGVLVLPLPWVHGTAGLPFRRGFPTPSATSSEVATQTLIETSLQVSCSIFEKHVPLALFLSIMYLSCFFLCSCFIPLLVARKFSQAHAIQCLIHNHHHPGRPLPQVKLQIQMVFGSQSPVGR